MSDTDVEISYWTVIKDIVAPEDPMARLKAALPEFLAATGSATEAGNVIVEHLNGINWDWPAWHAFAEKTGRDSLPEVAASISKMRSRDLLRSLRVSELRQLCTDQSVALDTKVLKEQIVDALLRRLTPQSKEEILEPIRRRIFDRESQRCRKKMAIYMAARITGLAYNMERYEQLEVFPFWRFVWSGATDVDAPRGCRIFNNKRLSAADAKQKFPALPCDYLQCGCYIVGESEIVRRIRPTLRST